MNDYKYLNKIVIEALKEWPKPPIISRETDGYDDYFDFEYPMLPAKSTVAFSDIDLSQWKVTLHYEYLERYKKVAEIVGEEKAAEVLRALDS